MKPWLLLPPSLAHSLAPAMLKTAGAFRSYKTFSWKPLEWRGLNFSNRLGIAAGVDKDGTQIRDWWTFGPGFIEIGTVVPKPQLANPGPIFDRDKKSFSLWNKMGFPSRGYSYVKKQLLNLEDRYHTPLFINIGKNRDTPLEKASSDYILLMHELAIFADAFVINISSPNTQGLRKLLSKEYFVDFLGPIIEKRNSLGATPLLLKISPDLSDKELQLVIEQSLQLNIDGWVVTNTTLQRPPPLRFPRDGGVSGKPLASLSKQTLRKSLEILGNNKSDRLMISVGGIMNAEDINERLELGADLVEVYTALVFEGPFFFKKVAKHFLRN